MRKLVPYLLVAAVIVLLDQLTKWLIVQSMPLGASFAVAPILDIVHVRNRGAAFSFLAGASGWQRELFIGIALAASLWITWMLARSTGQRLFCAALTLILGGAVGNLIDRLHLGAVVDFLHFHWQTAYFPAFNVADSAITCGAGLVVVDAFIQSRRQGAGRDAARGSP